MANEFSIFDENSYVNTNDRFFYNSEALFIKYEDILGMPWFTYISIMRSNYERLNNILDLELLKNCNMNDLLLWYMTRKEKNPIYQLMRDKSVEKEKIDEFLKHEMIDPKAYMLFNTYYEFMTMPDALDQIINNNFVDEIYIYSEYQNPNVERFIQDKYKDAKYAYGDLEESLKNVPNDTTYIFDMSISFLKTLIKLDKLNMASIACPMEYEYNDSVEDFITYVDSLRKDYVFKLHFLNVIR